MNAKLIDSLVQIISSLSEEERESLSAKLNKERGEKTFNLTNQPFVGMWKDRNDLADSSNWVRQHRQNEWTNKHD